MKKVIILAAMLIVLVSLPIHTAFADNSMQWSKNKDIATEELKDVLFAGNIFVSVGNDGVIKTSADGVKWNNAVSGTTNNLRKILYLKNSFIVVGDNGTILTSSNGSDWRSVQSGVNSNLNGIASNGDIIVIVGEKGTVLSSSDNTKWTSHFVDNNVTLNSVTWYKNQFVAVGSFGFIMTSPDSNIWTSRKSGIVDSLYGVTSNDDGLVAVGAYGCRREDTTSRISYGNILTSKDGVTWAAKELVGSDLFDVKWNGSEFIAAGGGASVSIDSNLLSGKIFTSKDGIDWSETTVKSCHVLNGIACNDSSFIAVGRNSEIVRCSDHIIWDKIAKDVPSGIRSIASNGKTFVMADDEGGIYTSEDGNNWTEKDLTNIDKVIEPGDIKTVIWTGKEFLITAQSHSSYDAFFLISPDGNTWRVFDVTKNYLHDVVRDLSEHLYDSGKHLLVGSDKTILTSADELGWNVTDISYNGKEYVAAESLYMNNNIIHSTDGINWRRDVQQENAILHSVASNGKISVAVGEKYDPPVLEEPKEKPKDEIPASPEAKGLILTSYDGMKWSKSKYICSEELQNIKWNGSAFIAVGDNGYICTSNDGLSWQQQPSPTKNILEGIVWNDKKIIITGKNNTFLECSLSGQQIENTIQFSLSTQHKNKQNLIEWGKVQETGIRFCDACWNGKMFVAVGESKNGGIVLSSVDGIKWSESYSDKSCKYNSIVWNGSMFVIGGNAIDGNNKSSSITLTSYDGNKWTYHDLDISSCVIEGIEWNGKEFVAFGFPDRILNSNDGVKWFSKTLDKSCDTPEVYWDSSKIKLGGHVWDIVNSKKGHFSKNNKLAVLVGYNEKILTSADCKNWSEQECSYQDCSYSGLADVVWDGKEFIAVGAEGNCIMSTSGYDWSKVYLPTGSNVCKVMWNGEKLIAVCEDGTILLGNSPNLIKVVINGTPIIFDVAPEVVNGRTLVPFRTISEALGAKIDWDESTKSIKAVNGSTVVSLTVGDNKASVNGVAKLLDVPATVIDGRTLVPMRFIAESLGAQVDWNAETKTITINTSNH